jgi:hypothetical protein
LKTSHQSSERFDIPTHLPTVARISCSTIIESYLRNKDRRNRNSQVNQTGETITAWNAFALRRSRSNNFKGDSSFSSITWKDYQNIACKVPGLAPRFMKLPPAKKQNVGLRVVTDDSKEKWCHLSNNIATETHRIQGRKLVSSRPTRSICCAAGLCYCPDSTHDAANRVLHRTLTSSF